MNVVVHRRDRDFTVLPNEAVRDERLSFRARGVLAFLLSHVDGFSTSADAVAAKAQEGRDAIRSAFRELKDAGYMLERRESMGRGRIRTVLLVTDTPGAFPLVAPEAGYQASVDQSPVDQASLEELREEPVPLPSVTAAPNFVAEFIDAYRLHHQGVSPLRPGAVGTWAKQAVKVGRSVDSIRAVVAQAALEGRQTPGELDVIDRQLRGVAPRGPRPARGLAALATLVEEEA